MQLIWHHSKTDGFHWFGHIFRLPHDAAVKIAPTEAIKPVNILTGGQRLTLPKKIEELKPSETLK